MNDIEQMVTCLGGQAATGRHVGARQQQVSKWVHQGWVPLKHVIPLGKLSLTSPHSLNELFEQDAATVLLEHWKNEAKLRRRRRRFHRDRAV